MSKSERKLPHREELEQARREAMDFAGIGLASFAPDGTVRWMDDTALTVFGLNEGSPHSGPVAGKAITDLVNLTDPEVLLGALAQELGDGHSLDYSYLSSGGELRWVSHSGHLAEDVRSGGRSVLVSLRDVSQRKRMEVALQESEARFTRFASAVTDVIYRYNCTLWKYRASV